MGRRLDKKVALITGTSGGMGRAAALLFAKEGARIVGCGRNVKNNQETVRMVRQAGGEMVSIEPLDLTDAKQVQDLVELTEKTYGRLDVLFNNASAARFASITDMTWEDWQFTMRNELDLVFIMIKAALPLMIRSGKGSIINTASISGLAASAASVAHAATKGGVIAMSRTLSLELAPKGIRVNAIAPGVIDTPGAGEFISNPAIMDMLLKTIPMGRVGQPEEIANVALFLASDESSYITGTTIVADGGKIAP
ncbi:MAG: SDR family oxidoreductase [Desulfobacterium sp.]|nr:SDR family oxidoreductase [Desulfobacterium sp.]MBU3947945.1 SDR family oxidoreductase [Pseudomonadota bacterium]MBU4009590.1 SDR family oxidoreductase [Pseudomonadota bacterium]MBU4037935.1 SDR family oxidoreductase [Pseudomonadota bacterium]